MQKLAGLFFVMIACYTTSGQQLSIRVAVSAENQASTPVRVQLSKPLSTSASYQLYNQKTRKIIPAQFLDSITLVFMTEESLPPGDYIYSLRTGKKDNSSPVALDKKEDGLLVRIKSKPVLFYHVKEAMPPADSPAYYKRSGFIHPLYSPSGKILTDDFPAGHAHQHAVFTAWANTRFKNSSVDFWNQQSKKGTVEHEQVLKVIRGPVFSQIKTLLRHKSIEFGEVLKEKWTITVYPVADYFLIDLESEQQNTTTDTLFLNTYHYGGIAFRGSKEWNSDDRENFKGPWHVLTSEGGRDSSANATHARWVNVWGNIDNTAVGVTVFNHPSNFRYPQAIRVHPTMPYWAYAPVVDGPSYIAPGAFYRSQFRYYIYEGEAQPALIEKLFKEWASPTTIQVTYR